MFLLSLRTRATTKNNSSDNARTMNCSLNNNTSHDPIMKSCFTTQLLQKHGLFHKINMFCDSVMLMKIPPRSQKVSIINIDYVSSLKNVSIMIGSGKKQEQQVRGSKEFGQGERYFL